MKKMFSFLPIVLFLFSFSSNAQLQCEEVELGEIGKSFWRDSLSNGLKGELVSQIQRKDDLTAKLSPEVEIALSPRVDFNFKFTRSVQDNLPLPSNGKISETDLFSLKVQNKLYFEFIGKKDGPFFFGDANAGVSLVHSTHKYPGYNMDGCKLYSKILDTSSDAGREVLSAACKDRDKSSFLKYFDATVDFFSQDLLGWGLKKLFDSEKNLEYAKDPLSALKLHSLLGLPIDSEVFRMDSNALAVGDIIEHTSFYGIKPLGVKLELVDFVTPSFAHYKRAFRTLSYKKLTGNKVLVEVEDTLLSGNELEIYRIRPKLLSIIKLNFGEWSIDNFRQQSLLQRFEIDLDDREGSGQEFFDKLLKSAYFPDFSLYKDSVLIDHTEYEDNVIADQAVYKDSAGDDDRLVLRIPKIVSYERRSYSKSDRIVHGENEYMSSEKLLRRKLERPWSFWKIPKADKKFECKLKMFSSSTVALDSDSSMNIECSYYNQFATEEQAKEAAEFIDMATLKNLDSGDRSILESTIFERADKINLYSNLSFSKKEIDRIVSASEEEIYDSLSKLIFGASAENVFSTKYHALWAKARPVIGPRKSAATKAIRNSKTYKECSSLLNILDITESYDDLYTKLDGIAGKNKGIDSYSSSRCYSYFSMAKEIAGKIIEFQKTVSKTGRLTKILDVFEDLNKVGLYQALLGTLAGGVDRDKVRFTYILTSPYIGDVIANTNGLKYDVENMKLKRTLRTELSPEYFSRVKNLRFTYNTCQPDVIISYLKLNYPILNREKINGKFKMVHFSDNTENSITEQVHSFRQMIRNEDNEYISKIRLDEPMEKDRSHKMFFEMMNGDDMRLSREVKVFLKKTYEHASPDIE